MFHENKSLVVDGYEDCLVGVVERFGMKPIYCFDKSKIIDKITSEENMSIEEANEHFDNNIIGSWVGEGTPCFLSPLSCCDLLDED